MLTIQVNVPCVEMFGKELYPSGCPILAEVRAWYKDDSLKDQANKYWKKASYIMQGFVRENGVAEDKAAREKGIADGREENPIRRIVLNKQIFNLVKAGLMDKDMENLPTDYDNGTDFKIIKTTKGQYADYGTSSYSRRESALTQAERDAIEKNGLNDLSEFLGKKPTAEELVIIEEMFQASVNGEQYDAAKWGKYYRPGNLKADSAATTDTTAAVAESEPVESDAETTAVTTPKTKSSTSDILEMIKKRGAAKA